MTVPEDPAAHLWADGIPDDALSWVVPADQTDRLDKWLKQALVDSDEDISVSREQLQSWIARGHVLLNGQIVRKTGLLLKPGDEVTCYPPAIVPLVFEPQEIPLEVVYEDAALLVVNKPVGMLTHPTGANRLGTLVNALLHYCRDGGLSGIGGVIRPGIVHRLDRDTAGLLVVAKTDAAHRHLSGQLHAKTMRRQYRAIAQGDFAQDAGTYRWPIARNPHHRQAMRVDEKGRSAVTHWRVNARLAGRFCAITCDLETGRTHQIRVHCAHAGHPLVGDMLYGTGLGQAWQLPLQGQALQAARLTFQHPDDGRTMTFELPASADLLATWRVLCHKQQADDSLQDPWTPPGGPVPSGGL